jgi:hypothetical protein
MSIDQNIIRSAGKPLEDFAKRGVLSFDFMIRELEDLESIG